jgi:energy-coupling factor transport system permease protein
MKEITIGQYYPVKSAIHALDPRTKILCAILIIAFTFVSKTFLGLLACALFVLAITFISHVPFKKMLSGLKAIWFILLFTFVLNVFFLKSGNIIFEWKFISITSGGLIRAFFMAFRLMLLILSAGLLTLTTSPIELTDGLERLLSPLKKIGFPAHEIAMMMSIALRFIPILSEETDKIMKAQSARGAVFNEGSLLKRARAITALLVPLLASAFHRALELANAMEARCYHGGEGRTRLKVLKMHKSDLVAFIIVILFVIVILTDSILLSKYLPYLVG